MPFPTQKTQGGVSNQVIAPNLRQVARGVSFTFETSIWENTAGTVPAVPVNQARYPAWTVLDPTGVQVATGVATPGSAPGRWQFPFHVPQTAPLSTQSAKWQVVWLLVTATNRQIQKTDAFDVIELRTPDTLEDLREGAYMTYRGESERLIFRLPKEVSEIRVSLFPATSLSSPVPCTTAAFTGSLADSAISVTEEQNLFVYYVDTPPLTDLGEYQVVWSYRYTITSPRETVTQRIFVPPAVFWSLAQSFRDLLDKLRKKYSSIQSYNDSFIFECYSRGMDYLNGVTPRSQWNMENFPFSGGFTRFLIEAAALHGLRAQRLMAGELQFSFSGQLVTLDVDPTQAYDALIDQLERDLTGMEPGSFPPSKVDFARKAGPPAVTMGRIMGRGRGAWSPVFEVSRGPVGDMTSGPSSYLSTSLAQIFASLDLF